MQTKDGGDVRHSGVNWAQNVQCTSGVNVRGKMTPEARQYWRLLTRQHSQPHWDFPCGHWTDGWSESWATHTTVGPPWFWGRRTERERTPRPLKTRQREELTEDVQALGLLLYVDLIHYSLITGFTLIWWRQWHSTPVLLPGKSHGQRSLVGYSPWCR